VKSRKTADQAPARPSTATTDVTTEPRTRKPWIKKTPAEVVLAQIDRVKDDVARKEGEFREAKRQLERLEAARKVLEGT